MLRRRFITIGIVVGAGMACLDPSGLPSTVKHGSTSPLVPTGRSARSSVTAQLHVHGWSNHSGSSFPASIAWQTQQSAAAGVDVLWWTDHVEYYAHRLADFAVTPTTPSTISPRVWAVGTWGPGGAGAAFVRSTAGSLTTVSYEGAHLAVTLPPGDGSVTDTVTLFFGTLIAGQQRRAAFGALARPLIGDPRFRMTVWRDSASGQLPPLDVLVPLAWHPDGGEGHREVLHYVFRPNGAAPVRISGDTAIYSLAWPDSDSVVVALAPKADAAVFPDGLDNTTDEYRLLFSLPRSGDGTTLRFGLPVVGNHDSTSTVQMPPAIATAQGAARAYGIRSLWGIELAGTDPALSASPWASVSGAGVHIAVYLPNDVDPAFVDLPKGNLANLTSIVAARGGITSIPHPFGTSVAMPTGTLQDHLPHVDSLGAFLIQHGGWGANLIEVGYPVRGGVGLREHLHLLDYLLGSGLHLCGIGVTDSHGQRMMADPTITDEQDNFVTWIADVNPASSPAELVAAMRGCRVSFGSPFYVHGGLWVQVLADSVGQQRLALDYAGVSPSATYFLFEIIADSTGTGHEPTYRQLGAQVDPSRLPPVGGCLPSYARVEAWAGTRFLASSNVVRIASDPALCSTPTSRHLN